MDGVNDDGMATRLCGRKMGNKGVKQVRLQAWPAWLFLVVIGLGAFLICFALPSPDRVPDRGPQAVLVGLFGLGLC